MAIVCVGAIYIDTIFNVPHFPIEDQKLRASSHNRRRGGNGANTLEVIAQLAENLALQRDLDLRERHACPLFLLSVLPNKDSAAVKFIRDSLPQVSLDPTCIYRSDQSEAASSYILNNQQNGSRTIVSHNPLMEMTYEEFLQKATALRNAGVDEGWFHFEGRIPEVTVKCVGALRKSPEYKGFKISVECEKPERAEMVEAAKLSNVVFYSKLWAEYYGYTSARLFLESQINHTLENALLLCTWGSGGATAVQKVPGGDGIWAEAAAWAPEGGPRQVVDAIGAGDTFIAGTIFHSIARSDVNKKTLQEKVEFANEIAGRKVYQYGFKNLADEYTDARNKPNSSSIPPS